MNHFLLVLLLPISTVLSLALSSFMGEKFRERRLLEESKNHLKEQQKHSEKLEEQLSNEFSHIEDYQLGSLTDKQKAIQESLGFLNQLNDEIQRVQLENEKLRSQNHALRQANSNLETENDEIQEEINQLTKQLVQKQQHFHD